MPSTRVQRKQSIVQNTDNNNGGGMKKQGGPVTTGITHTYWHPVLSKTIITGKSSGNDKEPTVLKATIGVGNNILIITELVSGSIFVGQKIAGEGIPLNSTISSFITGKGGVGTYTISNSSTLDRTNETISGDPGVIYTWNNYGKTYKNNMYRPFNIFGFGTGSKFKNLTV